MRSRQKMHRQKAPHRPKIAGRQPRNSFIRRTTAVEYDTTTPISQIPQDYCALGITADQRYLTCAGESIMALLMTVIFSIRRQIRRKSDIRKKAAIPTLGMKHINSVCND